MSEIKETTVEEVKAEEALTYTPSEFVTIQIDKLAEEFVKNAYERWLKSAGAKVAAQAKAKEAAQAEIAKLNAAYEAKVTELDNFNLKLAKEKNWGEIAKNETAKATAKAELDKAVKKLMGEKVHTIRGDGSMAVDKMEWSKIRSSVFQFTYDGKAFIVTHSSNVKETVVKNASDHWLAQLCQPVTVIKGEGGSKKTDGIPTITGKPITLTFDVPKMSHSGFVNGVTAQLRTLGLVTLSEKTAYQPWQKEAVIEAAEYDWLVVKA